MNRRTKRILIAAALACACAGGSANVAYAKVTIELDYSLDTNGLFLPQSQNPFGFDGDMARAVLERAAQTFSDRFVDNLSAITPRIGPSQIEFSWQPNLRHPATGATHVLNNPAIPPNVIKVYAGGRALPGSTLGLGGPGGYGASGLQQWFDEIEGRGQLGALATPNSDYAPWGGGITFDTDANWHIGLTTTGLTTTKSDFYSVALHELGHLVGIGTADSWTAANAGGSFVGPKSSASYGGAVPLSPDGTHWAIQVPGSVPARRIQSPLGPGGPLQIVAMDPSITTGTRKKLTLLDWAGFDDLGWQLALAGDANADGTVNFDDLAAMAQNYNSMTGIARWSQGDFTEDGNVNFDDLALLAQGYNTSTPIEGAAVAAAFGSSFARDWEAALAQAQSVPEPGTVLLLTGAALILGRRRRRAL